VGAVLESIFHVKCVLLMLNKKVIKTILLHNADRKVRPLVPITIRITLKLILDVVATQITTHEKL